MRMMTKKFWALTFALVLMVAGISSGCGPKKTELSAADQEKMTALNVALKNGILSQSEYDAKVKELNAAASANSAAGKQISAADAQKLQALESACKSGVLSPDECASKRATLTGAASAPASGQGAGSGMAVVSAPADAPVAAPSPDTSSGAPAGNGGNGAGNGAMAGNSGNPASNPQMAGNGGNGSDNSQMAGNGGNSSNNAPMASAGGTSYNDPQGAFSLMVPQGWTASPQGDNGQGGVQIAQGSSWAIISPFASVKQPSDIVIGVEGQLRTQYKNLQIGNHGPAKFDGKLDMAYARYTGINPKGAGVTVVVIGIASPDGRYYLVMSSIPQNDTQGANQAMTAMVQSLHFAGQ